MDTFTPQPEQDTRKLEDPKDTSGLKFYSMALVVKTPKSFPSKIIEVTPIESLSIQNSGKVEQKDTTYKQVHQDASGAFDSQKDVTQNNVIEAEWMPFSDSNRATPPCVYQDESVLLFKYGDVQKYYWVTIKHQPELRKKEMVRWSASNETAPLVAYTKETSYFAEFNALTKKLEIGTPVSGEGVAYRILIDVGAGQLDIADNVGNSIVLKSNEGTLTFTTTKDVVVNAAGKVDVNAPTTNINSDKINLNGEVTVSKGISVANGITVAGGGGGKAATIGGDLYVKGSFQAQKINSNSITQGGYSSSDVSVQTAQNQSAKKASTPVFSGSGSAGGSSTETNTAYTEHPSPQTDKDYQVDHAATTNASGAKLTGDKVLDAPKLATGEIPKSFSMNIPGLGSIKETASKIGGMGQQLASTAGGVTSNFTGGIQGLVSTAQSVQGTVSSAVSGVTSQANSLVSQARNTVMDPINGITRQVSSTLRSVTSPVNSIASGFSNQVNGFLQPLNAISQSFTGKSLVNNPLGNLNQKVYGLTNKIDSVNQLVSNPLGKITNSISSATNTVAGAVSRSNYAAYNLTDPIRSATNTVQLIQNQAATTRRQLSELSTQASSLIPKSETLDQLF